MLDYFLQNSIKSGIKRYKREHSFFNYTDIKNVLILFDIEDWNEVQPIIENLKNDGKSVIAWTFKNNQIQSSRFPFYVKTIDPKKDLNWMRVFTAELLSEFRNANYETLIDLSSGDNDYLLHLLTLNRSRFCIGMMEREYKLYDFILLKEKEQDLLDTFEQMKNYLARIQ